ncbi:MAG: ABC transporter ATP-binding protein [Bacilli bacterium]|nr:ABC transporter ATP-binding protein/permease [Acholeplasmataceae bacterium]MDY2902851.1 ABC transporter ATP-binding protein [Bacilli bacterium]
MPPRGLKGNNKPKNFKQSFKRVLGYYKNHLPRVILSFVGLLLTTVLSLVATSRFMQQVLDALDYVTNPSINKGFEGLVGKDLVMAKWNSPEGAKAFTIACILMLSCFLLSALFNFMYERLMVKVTRSILEDFRNSLFESMEKLPIRYFDTHTHGELMSRYTNDIDATRQMISQAIPQTVSSVITVVATFIIMCLKSIELTIVTILSLVVVLLVTKSVIKKSGKFFMKQQKEIGTMNGFIEEMIEGQKVIKVFNHEKKAVEEFNEINENVCSAYINANKYAFAFGPISNNLNHIQYALTALVGGLLMITGFRIFPAQGVMTAPIIIVFLTLTKSFGRPISMVSQQINSVIVALAGAERVFEVMDTEPEADNGYVTLTYGEYDKNGNIVEVDHKTDLFLWKHPHGDGTTTLQKLEGNVVFDDVDFGYTPDKMVLHNVSLYAKPGQKIAFVGSTGAGKTTITNLINRFYDIQDGKIRIDGININKIKKSDLRKSQSIVLQDTHLFSDTVMENIRYGKLDATDEECIAAAKLANADYFISHLPNGYQTELVSDGSNLSQGQRQLLAIARAAVADPAVLILDEATSSIDTRTEKLIEEGMDQLMKGRTTFVIAHRLSTVRNSQAIMVLEHGVIIERGDHKSLLAQKGKYYQLYTGAFELD